jgi:Proline racemase
MGRAPAGSVRVRHTDRGRPDAVKRGHPDERFDASPRTLVAPEVHAGGEPGRVIVEGVGHLPGATMVEKMCHHPPGSGHCSAIEGGNSR